MPPPRSLDNALTTKASGRVAPLQSQEAVPSTQQNGGAPRRASITRRSSLRPENAPVKQRGGIHSYSIGDLSHLLRLQVGADVDKVEEIFMEVRACDATVCLWRMCEAGVPLCLAL